MYERVDPKLKTAQVNETPSEVLVTIKMTGSSTNRRIIL